MRPPVGVELAYRKSLRSLSDQWREIVEREIFPLLEATVEQRTDAVESPLAKAIRLASRPANDTSVAARVKVKGEIGALLKRSKLFGEKQRPLVNEIAGRVDKANAAEFKRVIGIDARQTGASIGPAIDQFREENVDLITSIPEDALGEVSDVIDESWTAGERVETLREKILDRFDVSKSRADLIARDQVLKLNGQITKERQQSAGITEYIWTTSGDERVRGNPALKRHGGADHYSLNGQTFRWDAPPVTNPDTGETNNPGQDYQCRCVAMPILSFLTETDDEPDE